RDPGGLGSGPGERVIAHGDRRATAVPNRLEDQRVTQCRRHPQAAGDRDRLLPSYGSGCTFVEGPYDGRTAITLHRVHPRQLSVYPAGLAQLAKALPHPDQPGAAAGRVNDRVGHGPPELLGDLQRQGLLALDAVRLAQRAEIERTLGYRECARLPATIANVTVEQYEVSAERSNLREDGRGRGCGCVHSHCDAGTGTVRRGGD